MDLFVIFLIILAAAGFLIALRSVRKLKIEIFSYYPFDLFAPKSGKWSIVYFLLSLAALLGVIYLLFLLQTPLRPA